MRQFKHQSLCLAQLNPASLLTFHKPDHLGIWLPFSIFVLTYLGFRVLHSPYDPGSDFTQINMVMWSLVTTACNGRETHMCAEHSLQLLNYAKYTARLDPSKALRHQGNQWKELKYLWRVWDEQVPPRSDIKVFCINSTSSLVTGFSIFSARPLVPTRLLKAHMGTEGFSWARQTWKQNCFSSEGLPYYLTK